MQFIYSSFIYRTLQASPLLAWSSIHLAFIEIVKGRGGFHTYDPVRNILISCHWLVIPLFPLCWRGVKETGVVLCPFSWCVSCVPLLQFRWACSYDSCSHWVHAPFRSCQELLVAWSLHGYGCLSSMLLWALLWVVMECAKRLKSFSVSKPHKHSET